MSRSSSPASLRLPAAIVGAVALLAAACSGSPANPTSPLSLSSNTSLSGGGAQPSSAGKVDVCHRSDSGFNLINVSGNALQAHLGHGDGLPLGFVPGSTNQMLSASCQVLQPQTLTLVSGSSGGIGSLDPAISYARASGGTGTAVVLKTHPAYHSLPGARWVNWAMITTWFDSNFGFGKPHIGDDIAYSIGFTLPAGAMNASLTGTFYADNRGDGFLNGAPIGGHAATPFEGGFITPASVGASSGFVPGANTLSFKVHDAGGVAGVAFSVTITYFAP